MRSGEKITNKIKRFNDKVEKNLPPLKPLQKTGVFFDFVKEYLFHGAYLEDYIQYGFYWKKRRDRENYIVFEKLMELKRTCNNPAYAHVLDDKFEFNRVYKDYIKRDFLNTAEANFNQFNDFLTDKEYIFVKKHDGSCGIGVDKVKVSDIKDREALFNSYKKSKTLCEGVLTQCSELAEFNESSINTLRIVTLIKADGEVKIMGGLLRMGRKGKIADNFHHNGIVAFLDGDTGVVSTTGVDRDYKRYIFHPDSNKQIVGFNIPYWEKIEATIKEAALLVPEMRYVGWDVAITADHQVAIIEGNVAAEPDGEQIATKEGRWPLYEKYLKDIRNL